MLVHSCFTLALRFHSTLPRLPTPPTHPTPTPTHPPCPPLLPLQYSRGRVDWISNNFPVPRLSFSQLISVHLTSVLDLDSRLLIALFLAGRDARWACGRVGVGRVDQSQWRRPLCQAVPGSQWDSMTVRY